MNNEALKILKENKKNLLVTLGISILGIILIIIGAAFSISPEDLEPKEYDELISNKQDTPDDYATVTITYLPYLFAEKDTDYGTKKYYMIFDENGYPYIARLTDETYKKLEAKYDNGEDISYKITGFLSAQETELRKLAIESHKELFEDSKITDENYELYFGKTFIDEEYVPSTTIEIIFISIGGISLIVGLICFIVCIVGVIRFKKTLNKYGKDELEYELAKSSTIYYKKQEVCLTDNYVITTFMGLDVIKYEDILWLYNENRRYNFISIGKYLIARTNNKKAIQLSYVYKNEAKLIEIMNKIHEKNPKILIGFTKENQNAYKEMTKKDKNK